MQQLNQLAIDGAKSNLRTVDRDSLKNLIDILDNITGDACAFSVNSSVITIGASDYQTLKSDGSYGTTNAEKKGIPPVASKYASIAASTFNVSTGAVTGDFAAGQAGLSMTTSHYVAVGFELRADKKWYFTWGTPQAVKADTLLVANSPAFSGSSILKRGVQILQKNGAGDWNFANPNIADYINMPIGGSGGGTGDANELVNRYLIRANNSSFGYVTPVVGSVNQEDLIDTGNSTATYDVADEAYVFTTGSEVVVSSNLLCDDFYAQEVDIDRAELIVYYDESNVDDSATYQMTREGNATTPEYQTVTMTKTDETSDGFRGVLTFADEAADSYTSNINTASHEFKTATAVASRSFINNNNGFYVKKVNLNLTKTGSPSGGLGIQFVRDNAGSPSTDPNDVINYAYLASSSIITGVNTINIEAAFDKATTYHLVITSDSAYNVSYADGVTEINIPSATSTDVQLKGRELDLRMKVTSSTACKVKAFGVLYKNESVIISSGSAIDNLVTENHLGSVNGANDRSVAGRGIFLRRPDGVLREISINNSDTIVVSSI